MNGEHPRLRPPVRGALVALVVGWLFWEPLRSTLPFWLPLAALTLVEGEVGLQAWRDRRAGVPRMTRRRRGPGDEDADLGWGTLVEDDEGARWIPPPPRPARRRRPLVTAVSVAAAVALVAVGVRQDRDRTWGALSGSERTATQARLQDEAARIAGRPVTVRCDESYAYTGARSDALGVAFPRRALAYLLPSVCRTLHDVLSSDSRAGSSTGEAIVVLAHEAVHLRGESREGVTECLALQEGAPLGVRLGLSAAEAARLMRVRYADALADRSVIRVAYQLPRGCEDGGSLDLDPESSRFP